MTSTRFAIGFGLVCSLLCPSNLIAKQVQLEVGLGHPTMLIVDGQKKATNHLRIGLNGFELPGQAERQPVNIAIVIDKSGSMQGEKIDQARKAALQAIDRLRDHDIVSVLAYDSSVEVLIPATKASDRKMIKDRIRSIGAGGNTALHAGVSQAAVEVRKFLDDKQVNRIILLSDGLANVGPSRPEELEQLGSSLINDGISVSTMGLGLGYNEDLMSRLALAASGNHVFIEDADNLVAVFQREFDDVLSVIAQKLHVHVQLSEGIRPVKLLGYPAEISGQTVDFDLGQLYSRQQRYFVLEIEVPFGRHEERMPVADVELSYLNMLTETSDKLTSAVEVRFSNDKEVADSDVDKEVLSDCIVQIANERNRQATLLRDAGKVEEAREMLIGNALFLKQYYEKLGIDELKSRSELNRSQSTRLTPQDWAANRKQMVESYFGDLNQQRYSGSGKKKPN